MFHVHHDAFDIAVHLGDIAEHCDIIVIVYLALTFQRRYSTLQLLHCAKQVVELCCFTSITFVASDMCEHSFVTACVHSIRICIFFAHD